MCEVGTAAGGKRGKQLLVAALVAALDPHGLHLDVRILGVPDIGDLVETLQPRPVGQAYRLAGRSVE